MGKRRERAKLNPTLFSNLIAQTASYGSGDEKMCASTSDLLRTSPNSIAHMMIRVKSAAKQPQNLRRRRAQREG